MASVSISKNTGRVRVFMDTIAAGVVRDANGDFAVFKAHGSDFIDVRTGEIYAGAAAAAYLLDTYTAFAAYSVRQLKSTATNSMRVRRSSDDAETDIGFSGGWLDETALLAHCGAGNGFVVTMYDQSENGRDATQSTAGDQPKIVTSGAIVKINSKPSLQTQSTTTKLVTASLASQAQPTTIFAVVKNDGATANVVRNATLGDYFRVGANTILYCGASLTATGTASNQVMLTALCNSTTSKVRINGAEDASGDAGTNAFINGVMNILGATSGLDVPYGQELLLFNDNQTANFAAIESNINTAFSIY